MKIVGMRMKRLFVFALIIAAPLITQANSIEGECRALASYAETSAFIYRDHRGISKKEMLAGWQDSILKDESLSYSEIEKNLNEAVFFANTIYDRYELLTPEMVSVKFKHDCIKEKWDFSATIKRRKQSQSSN